MPVSFAVNNSGLSRTVGAFLNPAGSFSFMLWVMNTAPVRDIVGATYQQYTILGDDTYAAPYVFTGALHGVSASPVTDFCLDALNAAAVEQTTTLTGYEYQTVWTHVAVTYNGGTHVFKQYLNGWLFDSITLDMSASGPFTREGIGLESEATHAGFSCAFYRSWAAELSQAEIRVEMASTAAVKATPFCDTPLTNAATLGDVSGNGRNWTGTAVTTGPTTLVVGSANTNTSAAAAYELAVPSMRTQSAGTSGFTTFVDLWYKITWDAADSYVSVFALGAPSGYAPNVKVYDGLTDALANTIYRGFNSTPSKPLTIPVYSGHVYYIYVPGVVLGSQQAPALAISAVERNNQDVPTGSLAVNDDTDGFPLTLLQSSSGYPLDYVMDFPAGEDAHILPNGKLIVNGIGSIGGDGIFIYPANVEDGPLAGPVSTGITFLSDSQVRMSSDRDSVFYICGTNAGGTAYVGTTISSTTYTASSTLFHPSRHSGAFQDLLAIAPSLDRTILYYSTTEEYIQRWDLVNDIALSDLASPIANFTLQGVGGSGTGDLLVMPDSTIVAGYQRSSGAIESKVLVYNPNGSTAATYTYADVLFNHLAHDGPNATTVWMWGFRGRSGLNGRLSVFMKIDLTDGSVLVESLDAPQYRVGGYLFTPTQAMTVGQRSDPITRFGHSSSCAFWVTRVESAPPTPEVFTIIEHPIRRLRRAPHLNNENKFVRYPGIELDFQRGIGVPNLNPGEDPVFMFRVSKDGGRTWSSYMKMHAGEMGKYRTRAVLKRLGTARDAVFEVTTSDPNNFVLTNAWLTPDPIPGDF